MVREHQCELLLGVGLALNVEPSILYAYITWWIDGGLLLKMRSKMDLGFVYNDEF